VSSVYKGGSSIAGRLQSRKTVTYKPVLSKHEKITLSFFLTLFLASSIGLVGYLVSSLVLSGFNVLLLIATVSALLVEIIRVLQTLTLVTYAYHAKDPIPMTPIQNQRLAVLTTIVPGKEPFELVAETLEAMQRIEPGSNNTLDVWLLDEGNDPYIKSRCKAMGVKHFSRKGIAKWNTESGQFRARTKHGNHNAWRSKYAKNYDFVAVIDPDHIPRPNFLKRSLGYFNDPDVAFVVTPQVYGNSRENWIANGSAFQSYIFNGIIQRGGNGLGAPLLTGTNHICRVSAMQQIKGYQDSIIEDHLTSLIIMGAENKKTHEKWKGVYTPDIIAIGEGPSSFTDYFNQQKRWSYGIWDVATTSTWGAIKNMKRGQALAFVMLQFFYPSVAIAWIFSSIATICFAGLSPQLFSLRPEVAVLWAYSFISGMSIFFWLRRFNLAEHERKDWGTRGMALMLMCIPVYVAAAIQAIAHKPLTFAVTAKGELMSPDTTQTFMPHFQWMVFNVVGLIGILYVTHDAFTSSVGWTLEHITICAVPIVIFSVTRLKAVRLSVDALSMRAFLKFMEVRHSFGEQ
jgi:cellulose synthase (UDP-forming)